MQKKKAYDRHALCFGYRICATCSHGFSEGDVAAILHRRAHTFILLMIQVVKRTRSVGSMTTASYKNKSTWRTWLRGLLILILAAFSGVGTGMLTRYFPAFTMPEPTGQFAIGTFSQQIVDESREETLSPEAGDKRELMINVWYPVDPEAAKGIKPESYPAELGKQSVWCLAFPLKCSAI